MNSFAVSVVICAYALERWTELVAAVASVRSQSVPASEIIVVSDHNAELLVRARARFAGVTAVANREARGLSGARNSGIAAAHGSIIAFLDDDAVAAPDWLEHLITHYRDDRVLGVGGAIEPRWPGRRPSWFPEEFDWVVGCSYRGTPTTTSPVRNLIGANMSFRREVFEAVGGFRTGIGRLGKRPLGCEETELCIRALQHRPGTMMLYEPRARVRHNVAENRLRLSYFWSRCYAEGLSKAHVSRFVGPAAGLATERAYTLRVLPRGVLCGLKAALVGDVTGLARSGAIVSGLMVTTAGYAAGRASASGRRLARAPSHGWLRASRRERARDGWRGPPPP
jgi:glucosyl-dolichyl phosphate glucuronosyltransferase